MAHLDLVKLSSFLCRKTYPCCKVLFPTRFRHSILTFVEDEHKNAFGVGEAKCHSGGRGAEVEGPRNEHHKMLDLLTMEKHALS